MADVADEVSDPTTKTVRWDDSVWQAGWTTIPNVILDLDISPVAFRVYVLFLRYAYLPDDKWPGQDEFAKQIPCSERTLREALRELETAGLLETRRRGLGKTNSYVLLAPETAAKSDGSRAAESAAPEPADSADPSMPLKESKSKGVASATPLRRGSNSSGEERPPGSPPKVAKVDGKNLPLDALCEVCGVDPRGPRLQEAIVALNGRLHRTTGRPLSEGMTHLFWREASDWAAEHGEADRLAAIEPTEYARALERAIRRKAERYRERHDGVEMSPSALLRWWFDLEKERPARRRAGMTADEMARFGT